MAAHHWLGCAIAALTGCVAGCAALSPPSAVAPGVAIPANWSAADNPSAGQATALQAWWQRFDDPLFSELVAQALQANTSVAGAQAALRQARAQRDVSAAGLWPLVNGSASVQRNATGEGEGSSRWQAGLDAGWEVDLFGGQRSAVTAGEAAAQGSAARLGALQVSVAAEVGLSYLALREAQLRLVLAQGNLASQIETLQLTDWRVQAGLLSSLEALQAQGAVVQTRAQLPLLQTRIEQSRNA